MGNLPASGCRWEISKNKSASMLHTSNATLCMSVYGRDPSVSVMDGGHDRDCWARLFPTVARGGGEGHKSASTSGSLRFSIHDVSFFCFPT